MRRLIVSCVFLLVVSSVKGQNDAAAQFRFILRDYKKITVDKNLTNIDSIVFNSNENRLVFRNLNANSSSLFYMKNLPTGKSTFEVYKDSCYAKDEIELKYGMNNFVKTVVIPENSAFLGKDPDYVTLSYDTAFIGYLNRNPFKTKRTVDEVIWVSFVLTEDGSMDSLKIVSGSNKELCEEVIDKLKHAPKFAPATKDGIPVRYRGAFPFQFKHR